MIFKNKNILIISPEPWSMMFVSKHHYAKALASLGNDVFFLNPPNQNFKNIEILPTEFHNVSIINYKPIFRGLRFLPIFLSNFCESIQKRIIEKKCDLKFDVIWSFEASRFFNFDIWDKKTIKILHIVDLNQDFEIKTAASNADICFCTTNFILQKLSSYNKKVFKINHGYNLPKTLNPKKLKGKIKAGYIGSLNIPYFDWEIAYTLVIQNPEVDFYFIGPLSVNKLIPQDLKTFKKFKDIKNVQFNGVIPALEIPNYLAAMDILLVLYKAQEYKEQLANPHKMMEYLGSGKIIVASYTEEYADKNHLLLMANKNEELPSMFKSAVFNLEVWKSKEKQMARKAFALENTYDKQIDRIEILLAHEKFG